MCIRDSHQYAAQRIGNGSSAKRNDNHAPSTSPALNDITMLPSAPAIAVSQTKTIRRTRPRWRYWSLRLGSFLGIAGGAVGVVIVVTCESLVCAHRMQCADMLGIERP